MVNDSMKNSFSNIFIVTGLSGAGKSTALQVLEDLHYFTVDCLPVNLVPEMVNLLGGRQLEHFKGVAIGVDVRQGNFLKELDKVIALLTEAGKKPAVMFLEADLSALIKRYATTRRLHPLENENVGLESALAEERKMLEPLRKIASIVFETTHFSIHDLRRAIQQRLGSEIANLFQIKVNIISFGFKYGVPKEADSVFDVRFLPNPYFEDNLRALSGKDELVSQYIFAHAQHQIFLDKLSDYLLYVIPLAKNEGRYRLSIAIGCTGGRHRSVATAEYIYCLLQQAGYHVSLEHRHLDLG